MNQEENYIETNKKAWNSKVQHHLESSFYDLPGFLDGKNSLKEIELQLLGNIKDKSVLHLQCHFGQDTISLSRLGANATGVDFSDIAIKEAKKLAIETNSATKFICCDVYDLPNHLNEKFDIIFTSYGTIGWLPDLDKWAKIISNFLKPNGKFVFVEFHPVVWMFDDDFSKIEYNYFNTDAIVEKTEGSYADKNATISNTNITWNHSLSEVINSLINNGLNILKFEEYNYSPYNCFNNTLEIEPDKFIIKNIGDKIPMTFAIHAIKTN